MNTTEQLATISSPPSGGLYKIQAPNSPVNNTQIVLPANVTPYIVNIFQSTSDDQVVLKLEPSVFLKTPVKFTFERNKTIVQKIDYFDDKSPGSRLLSGPTDISRITNEIVACPWMLIKVKKETESEDDLFDNDLTKVIGSNKIHFLKKYDDPNLVPAFMESLNAVIGSISNTNIYIADSTLPLVAGVFGIHPYGSENDLYFNLTVLNEISNKVKVSAFTKYTILHEYYHIRQTRARGCEPDGFFNIPVGYTNLSEGSADYSALFDLSPVDRKEVISNYEYDEFKVFPYEIANSFLSQGIFLPGVQYETRLIWDYFFFDPLSFFENYGKDYQNSLSNLGTPFSNTKNNEDVLRILKLTGGGSITASMLNLTDGVNNFDYPRNGKLTALLKEAPFLDGWQSTPETINQIKLFNDSDPKMVFNLPALSGVSRNFLMSDLITKLPLANRRDILGIEILDDTNLKLNVRSFSVSKDGKVLPSRISFNTDGNLVKTEFADTSLLSSELKNEIIVINIVNAGLEDIKNVKLKIRFLLPDLAVNVPGTIINATDSTLLNYFGTTNYNNKLSATAKDRRDIENSTKFKFYYSTFDSTQFKISNNGFNGSTQENVSSITDIGIPFSKYVYAFKVSATNKFGTITKDFRVETMKDSPPVVSLVEKTCQYVIFYQYARPGYVAKFLVTDPDSPSAYLNDGSSPTANYFSASIAMSNNNNSEDSSYNITYGGVDFYGDRVITFASSSDAFVTLTVPYAPCDTSRLPAGF